MHNFNPTFAVRVVDVREVRLDHRKACKRDLEDRRDRFDLEKRVGGLPTFGESVLSSVDCVGGL